MSLDAGRRRRLVRPARYAVAALVIVAAAGAMLFAMGREPICTCGYVKVWEGEVAGPGNSQHLTDWYTPSHLIHGFVFYGLGVLVLRGRSTGARFLAALVVEAAWEIAENSDAVIQRYRTATVALDYYGDSILNSMSDIGTMSVGFALAARLPVPATLLIAVFLELFTGWMVRDNLTLNIVMLLYPLDAIRTWQAGA